MADIRIKDLAAEITSFLDTHYLVASSADRTEEERISIVNAIKALLSRGADGDFELRADKNADGTGDIVGYIGSTEVFRFANNGSGDGGSLKLVSLNEAKLATLTGDEIAYVNVNGVASVQDADGVHGVVLADKWSDPKGGLVFDGVNDSAIVPANTNHNFGDRDYSVEIWLVITNSSVAGRIFAKSNSGSTKYVSLDYGNGTSKHFRFLEYDGSNLNNVQTDNEFGEGIYHIVILRKENAIEIWINRKIEKISSITALDTDQNEPMYFGSLKGVSDFLGFKLLDVHFYNMDVSDYIEQLYNNGSHETAVIPYELQKASQEDFYGGAGDFSSSTGWYLSSGASISGGQLILTADSNVQYAWHSISPSSKTDKRFVMKYKVVSNSLVGSGKLQIMGRNLSSAQALALEDIELDTGVGEHITEPFKSSPASSCVEEGLEITGGYTGGQIVIDDVKLIQVGDVLSLDSLDAGSNGWINTLGGELSIADTVGSPRALIGLKDGRSGISTTEVQLENTQKAVTMLKGFIAIEKGGVNNSIALGTATGSYDLLDATAGALTANEEKYFEINSYSGSERDLFAVAGASSVDIILIYEEIA